MIGSFFGFLVVGVLLPAIATIAAADDAKDEAIKKDRKQIEGTWRIVVLEINGNKANAEDAKKLKVVNGSDGTWSLRSDDKETSKGTSTFDPTQKPKTIDFTVTDGGGKGEQYLGIYDLGENTRKLCFGAEENSAGRFLPGGKAEQFHTMRTRGEAQSGHISEISLLATPDYPRSSSRVATTSPHCRRRLSVCRP